MDGAATKIFLEEMATTSTNQSDARKSDASARRGVRDSFEGRFAMITNALTAVVMVGGILAAIVLTIYPGIGERAQLIGYAGAALLVIGAFAFRYWHRKRAADNEAQSKVAERPASPTSMLRELLPFETGDRLLGRDADVRRIYTMLNAADFRFGVVWGQSGCGKTSLMRAGLIPKLKEEGWHIVSVNRPTEDPVTALAREINRRGLDGAPITGSGPQVPDLDALVAVHGRTAIVYDQFEEFFLLRRTRSAQTEFREQLARWVSQHDLRIVFLISIRDDYFAHLQDLAPAVPDPTSLTLSDQLSNFHPEQAREVLAESLATEQASVSQELLDVVITELTSDEFVRPPELQLVGSHLQRHGITQLLRFRAEGGVSGVLRLHIRNAINRSGAPEIASEVLRALCAREGLTKSPNDRTVGELVADVSAEGGETHKREQIHRVLVRLVEARIVVGNDEDGFNLVHDYFAPLTFAATEGYETNREKADRILERYVAEYRGDSRTRIPAGMIGDVLRHANPDLRGRLEAKKLIRLSRLTASKTYAVVAGLIFAIAVGLYGTNFVAGYLDTEAPLAATNVDHIVVRSGHPLLKVS